MTTIVSVKPQYGVNYKDGFIGFIYNDSSFISLGISWFTNWERGQNPDVPNIPISHTLIVTGPNECVEANFPKIKRSLLTDYFNDPHNHIFFRKPVGLNDDISKRIIDTAYSKIGKLYDWTLLIGHTISNSFIGIILDVLTKGKSKEFFTNLFNKKNRMICSELAAYCLNEQPEYKGKGTLLKKLSSIDPQQFFQDKVIFTPWKGQ